MTTKAQEAFEKWAVDKLLPHNHKTGFLAGYAQGRADLLAEIKARVCIIDHYMNVKYYYLPEGEE